MKTSRDYIEEPIQTLMRAMEIIHNRATMISLLPDSEDKMEFLESDYKALYITMMSGIRLTHNLSYMANSGAISGEFAAHVIAPYLAAAKVILGEA